MTLISPLMTRISIEDPYNYTGDFNIFFSDFNYSNGDSDDSNGLNIEYNSSSNDILLH